MILADQFTFNLNSYGTSKRNIFLPVSHRKAAETDGNKNF